MSVQVVKHSFSYETVSLSTHLSSIKWNIIRINFPCTVAVVKWVSISVTQQQETINKVTVDCKNILAVATGSSSPAWLQQRCLTSVWLLVGFLLLLHTQVSYELSSSSFRPEGRAGCRGQSPSWERPSSQLSHWAPVGETRQWRDGSEQWVGLERDLEGVFKIKLRAAGWLKGYEKKNTLTSLGL